jgi:hypothetical protein
MQRSVYLILCRTGKLVSSHQKLETEMSRRFYCFPLLMSIFRLFSKVRDYEKEIT